MDDFAAEIAAGERFEFGKNWQRFLAVVDDERIVEAEKSLRHMLEIDSFGGKRFLDIGAGSGLFSLAARRLGAKVHSFDYDPEAVGCARELKRRYFADDRDWVVERGDVLDADYLKALGAFDVVYAWGVLHHTGAMWKALDTVRVVVAPGGKLFISIYNDQGWRSRVWRRIKKYYCSSTTGKIVVSSYFVPYFVFSSLAADIIKRRNPVKQYTEYKKSRGMSRVHDWFDWLGGFPFEVARPEEVFEFYREHGFHMKKLKTCGGGLGCNQFVFEYVAGKGAGQR